MPSRLARPPLCPGNRDRNHRRGSRRCTQGSQFTSIAFSRAAPLGGVRASSEGRPPSPICSSSSTRPPNSRMDWDLDRASNPCAFRQHCSIEVDSHEDRTCPAAATRTILLLLLSSLPGAFIQGEEHVKCPDVFSSSQAKAVTRTSSTFVATKDDPASVEAVAPKEPLFRRLPADAARDPRPIGAPAASLRCGPSDSEPECRDKAVTRGPQKR